MFRTPVRSRRRGKGHRDTHAARCPCSRGRRRRGRSRPGGQRPTGGLPGAAHRRGAGHRAPARRVRPRPPPARRRGRAPARPLRSLEPELSPLRHAHAVRAALRRLRGHPAGRAHLAGRRRPARRARHGRGRLRPGLGNRRAGPGAAEDDDRPLPGGRQDLRRQRRGAGRPADAADLRRARPRRLAPAPHDGRPERQQGTPNVGVLSPEELRSVYERPAGVTGQGASVAILGNGATDSVIADLHAFDAEHGIAPLPVDVVHVPAGGTSRTRAAMFYPARRRQLRIAPNCEGRSNS